MTTAVTCSHCGKPFRADPTGLTVLAGKKRDDGTHPLEYRFTCAHCGKWTTTPPSPMTVERSDQPRSAT